MATYTHVWQCINCGYVIRRYSTKENMPIPSTIPKNCPNNPSGKKPAPHIMIKIS